MPVTAGPSDSLRSEASDARLESGSGTCICQGTEVASRLTYLLNNLNLRHCTPVFTHAPEESVNRIFLHSLFSGRCVGLSAAEAQTESKTSNPARGCRNNATRASAVLKLKQSSSYTAESGSGPVILLSLLSIFFFFFFTLPLRFRFEF